LRAEDRARLLADEASRADLAAQEAGVLARHWESNSAHSAAARLRAEDRARLTEAEAARAALAARDAEVVREGLAAEAAVSRDRRLLAEDRARLGEAEAARSVLLARDSDLVASLAQHSLLDRDRRVLAETEVVARAERLARMAPPSPVVTQTITRSPVSTQITRTSMSPTRRFL
jgi:hypothetical protein